MNEVLVGCRLFRKNDKNSNKQGVLKGHILWDLWDFPVVLISKQVLVSYEYCDIISVVKSSQKTHMSKSNTIKVNYDFSKS